jgi:hypothetical protein
METLIKAFPAPNFCCKAAIFSANSCASLEFSELSQRSPDGPACRFALKTKTRQIHTSMLCLVSFFSLNASVFAWCAVRAKSPGTS